MRFQKNGEQRRYGQYGREAAKDSKNRKDNYIPPCPRKTRKNTEFKTKPVPLQFSAPSVSSVDKQLQFFESFASSR